MDLTQFISRNPIERVPTAKRQTTPCPPWTRAGSPASRPVRTKSCSAKGKREVTGFQPPREGTEDQATSFASTR